MNNIHWQELEARFKNAKNEYATLKKLCEGQVVRWEWFKRGEGYALEPFYFERSGNSQGKLLDKEPSNVKKCEWLCFCYGFDEQKRIVVIREGFDLSGESYREEFFVHKANLIESIRYNVPEREKQPIRLMFRHFTEGKIVKYESFGVPRVRLHDCLIETYEYSGDRLVGVKINHFREKQNPTIDEDFYSEVSTQHDDLIYDETGHLLHIIRLGTDGSVRTIYQKLKQGQTVKTLSILVERKLIELIPQIVASARIQERVYCLALVYADDMCLPPSVGLGLEIERAACIEKYDETGVEFIWSPADFTNYNTPSLEFNDKELLEACELLNRELVYKGSSTPVKRLFKHKVT